MRDRQLDQVDLAGLDIGNRLRAFQHDTVVAVREVADDERGGVDAARGGNGEGVHVGHDAAVEGPRRVLVDRLDIVVDLRDLDLYAVLIGPLLHEAAFSRIPPGHPAGIDRPGDLEVFLFGGGGWHDDRGRDAGNTERETEDVLEGAAH